MIYYLVNEIHYHLKIVLFLFKKYCWPHVVSQVLYLI